MTASVGAPYDGLDIKYVVVASVNAEVAKGCIGSASRSRSGC
jgi:hypothetical protein